MSRLAPTIGHHDATYLVRRGRIWQFRRAVPSELASLDPRKEIRITTATGDRCKAALAAAKINQALETYWQNLIDEAAGRQKAAHVAEFAEAVADARTYDLVYRPAAQIAEQPLADIVARVKVIDTAVAPPTRKLVAAVLGGYFRSASDFACIFTSWPPWH